MGTFVLFTAHIHVNNLELTHALGQSVTLLIRVKIELVVAHAMCVSPISVPVTARVPIPLVSYNGSAFGLQQYLL